MSKLSSSKTIFLLSFFCVATAITSPAQVDCSIAAPCFKILVSFNGTDGQAPEYGPPLVQGRDGNFYGTTYAGGAHGEGNVYKITAGGVLTSLYSFCPTYCADGRLPYSGVVLATDGNFYGTTSGGGANGDHGTVFKLSPEPIDGCPMGSNTGNGWCETVLYSFCLKTGCTDGSYPYAGLVQAANGNFYGTTGFGGANGDYGTVFEITTGRKLTTLHSFDGSGYEPSGTLVQATDGNFYGTTSAYDGTVFKITAGGTLTTLHSFEGTDGANPTGLVQAADGNFYGTTLHGGANAAGTFFEITPGGKLITLYNFCSQTGCTDGGVPIEELVQATDGNFYGTTSQGGIVGSCGNYGCGTVFKITHTGALTTLHRFSGYPADGAMPQGGLLQATNWSFYGTTTIGGTNYDGTVFSLSVGLGPFVEAVAYSGKVGNTIEFLGQHFALSDTVSFNGTATTPKTVSSTGTYLTANVPNGATTGFVTVTTSSGTLKSNKKFRVIPQITSFSPTSGPVGTSVTIMGISLKQTTKVTFGGVPATSVTVNSDTQLTATVPSGAKTGKIAVTTPGGAATSSGTFTVT